MATFSRRTRAITPGGRDHERGALAKRGKSGAELKTVKNQGGMGPCSTPGPPGHLCKRVEKRVVKDPTQARLRAVFETCQTMPKRHSKFQDERAKRTEITERKTEKFRGRKGGRPDAEKGRERKVLQTQNHRQVQRKKSRVQEERGRQMFSSDWGGAELSRWKQPWRLRWGRWKPE